MRQTDYSSSYFIPPPPPQSAQHHYNNGGLSTNNTIRLNDDLQQQPSASASSNIDIWKQLEHRMNVGLELAELGRRYCAYCGLKEDTTTEDECGGGKKKQGVGGGGGGGVILGRCYGCQLTYYCSQEHQHLDWLEAHMPKCAELEWVSLCELVQAIQISVPLPASGQFWPMSAAVATDVRTWTDWFELRGDLVKCAHSVAKSMEQNLINRAHFNNKLNRREPSLGLGKFYFYRAF